MFSTTGENDLSQLYLQRDWQQVKVDGNVLMHEKGGRKIMGNLKSRRIKKMEKKKDGWWEVNESWSAED